MSDTKNFKQSYDDFCKLRDIEMENLKSTKVNHEACIRKMIKESLHMTQKIKALEKQLSFLMTLIS